MVTVNDPPFSDNKPTSNSSNSKSIDNFRLPSSMNNTYAQPPLGFGDNQHIQSHQPVESAFNPNTFMHFGGATRNFAGQFTLPSQQSGSRLNEDDGDEIKLSDYIIEDVPLLMSDDEELSDDDEAKSASNSKNQTAQEPINNKTTKDSINALNDTSDISITQNNNNNDPNNDNNSDINNDNNKSAAHSSFDNEGISHTGNPSVNQHHRQFDSSVGPMKPSEAAEAVKQSMKIEAEAEIKAKEYHYQQQQHQQQQQAQVEKANPDSMLNSVEKLRLNSGVKLERKGSPDFDMNSAPSSVVSSVVSPDSGMTTTATTPAGSFYHKPASQHHPNPTKASQSQRDRKHQQLQAHTNKSNIQQLSEAQFLFERKQLMTIMVKYISTKIINSFPPESPRTVKPNELPLDKFLLILVSRLQLSLSNFMRGVIYLFRYMDIIYLLRYLNQSNNFANYNEMDFELKKLIVGCFKLTLIRERIKKDWVAVTGLPNNEINRVVKTIVGRLNGKILIKDIELVKLKSEMFRFVKMVTNRV